MVYISAETAAMIEDIFAASGTSIEILNDLLDYERIDSGGCLDCCLIAFRLVPGPYNLGLLLVTRDIETGVSLAPTSAVLREELFLGQDAG